MAYRFGCIRGMALHVIIIFYFILFNISILLLTHNSLELASAIFLQTPYTETNFSGKDYLKNI